jgi:hypothetical protein
MGFFLGVDALNPRGEMNYIIEVSPGPSCLALGTLDLDVLIQVTWNSCFDYL